MRRAVFFDFGGTLCHSLGDFLPTIQEAAGRARVSLPWEDFLRANEDCWNELWPEAPGLVGKIPAFADRVHERALERIRFKGPIATLVRYIREEVTSPRWHQPFPETAEILALLQADGFPLHVISGNVDYLPIIIENLGWTDRFRTVTFTQEVGAQKPDPRVFQFALRRAGQSPEESVYVGDSWEADYLGATGAGMSAVWLNRTGKAAPSSCPQIKTLRELPSILSGLAP